MAAIPTSLCTWGSTSESPKTGQRNGWNWSPTPLPSLNIQLSPTADTNTNPCAFRSCKGTAQILLCVPLLSLPAFIPAFTLLLSMQINLASVLTFTYSSALDAFLWQRHGPLHKRNQKRALCIQITCYNSCIWWGLNSLLGPTNRELLWQIYHWYMYYSGVYSSLISYHLHVEIRH